MHRDKKVGLALGILLIGTVGAFFFRDDGSPHLDVPTLTDPAGVDQMVDEISRPRPYPSADVVQLTGPEADQGRSLREPAEPAESAISMPAIDIEVSDGAWVEPQPGDWGQDQNFPVGPPDPISVSRDEESRGSESPPIPRQDPNASWNASPASDSGRSPAVGPSSRAPDETQYYTARSGDTLSEIAQKFLGTSRRYREIYELNRDQLRSPNDLRVGMRLKIPPRDATGRSSRSPIASQPDRRQQVIPSSTGPTTSYEPTGLFEDVKQDRTMFSRDVVEPASKSDSDDGQDASESRFVPFRRSPLAPRASSDPHPKTSAVDREPFDDQGGSGRATTAADPNQGWRRLHQKSPQELIADRADAAPNESNPNELARSEATHGDDARIATAGESRRGTPSSSGTRYIVRPGDSLEQIARKFYGSSAAVGRIQDANPQAGDPLQPLAAGTQLVLP